MHTTKHCECWDVERNVILFLSRKNTEPILIDIAISQIGFSADDINGCSQTGSYYIVLLCLTVLRGYNVYT